MNRYGIIWVGVNILVQKQIPKLSKIILVRNIFPEQQKLFLLEFEGDGECPFSESGAEYIVYYLHMPKPLGILHVA